MPTNRRRRLPRRIGGRLNDRQRAELLIGPGLAPRFGRGQPGFEGDDHARQAWFRHRDELLADRDFAGNEPGCRPWGFWRHEVGLRRDNFGWRWPRGCRDERQTVYKFHADEAERALIEAHWLTYPAAAPPWFRRKPCRRMIRSASSAVRSAGC